MFDKYAKQAAENKPPDYNRVMFGKLRPDDLVWSVMEKTYRRADDPEWLYPAEDADIVTYAIREQSRLRPEPAPGQSRRTFALQSAESEGSEPKPGQLDLFG